MIQQETRLHVADNTGAKEPLAIRVFGGSEWRYVSIGDVIVASVKGTIPDGSVRKGDAVKVVTTRIVKEPRRADGSYIRSGENAAVILGSGREPKGIRIFRSVGRELCEHKSIKIISLAPEVI